MIKTYVVLLKSFFTFSLSLPLFEEKTVLVVLFAGKDLRNSDCLHTKAIA